MLTILKLLKSDIEMLNYPFQMASLQGGIQKKQKEHSNHNLGKPPNNESETKKKLKRRKSQSFLK